MGKINTKRKIVKPPAQHAPVNSSALRPKSRGLLRVDPEPCSFTLSAKTGLGVAERANVRGWLGRSKTFALPFFHEETEIDDIEDTQQG